MQIATIHLLFFILSQIEFVQSDDALIETLSFGIEMKIQCNETYLEIDEINNDVLTWRFAHPSSFCRAKQKVESFVDECGVQSIDEKYLKARLMRTIRSKVSKHVEFASVYCPINYKPIAPMIDVQRSGDKSDSFYQFNLTATGLESNQSFEILWTKRVHSIHSKSVNYWFYPECVIHGINIRQNNNHTIVFTVSDSIVSRVEFVIRRCYSTCRMYEKCSDDYHPSLHEYSKPDSLETISCNEQCLQGSILSSLSPQTTVNNLFSSTIELSQEKQMIKSFLYYSLVAFILILIFIIIACFLLSRTKGLRADNVYSKTTSINMDENKETINE